MIKNKKVIALIPARSGSKGIKNKNIIDLNGKPLISYSIEVAQKSEYIDKIIVSTDSEKYKKIVETYGAEVPFIRPNELALDNTKTIDVVLHLIKYLKAVGDAYDILVLLQPTQPFRTSDMIDEALRFYINNGEKSVASISLVKDNPILIRKIDDNHKLKSILNLNSTCRRQDMDKYYKIDGSVYINSINHINENTSFNDNELGFINPNKFIVDIDTYEDLWIAQKYLEKMKEDNKGI